MKRHIIAVQLGLTATLFSSTAFAESWVQIEALPSLTQGLTAARGYASRLQSVAGFRQNGRWHSIALGPFATDEAAQAALQELRAQNLIPRDSFVSDGAAYRQSFWPVGGALTQTQTGQAPVSPNTLQTTQVEQSQIQTASRNPEQPDLQLNAVQLPEETQAQARLTERALNRSEREALQTALKFSGFYSSAIDGSFGPGTRRAMAAWQTANGHQASGILTSAQRIDALRSYETAIASLGLTQITDEIAGLNITLPLGQVEFANYSPPFAKYTSKNDSGVEVLLISQTGNEATLSGLYDIMQTLEIIPLTGERNRSKTQFTLTGQNSTLTSHTEARLINGHVKGFTLTWPTGDDARRALALTAMQNWSATPSVLPDAQDQDGIQDLDLLAGLNIRKADKIGSGVYIDAKGRVLTAKENVETCAQIYLEDSIPAQIISQSDDLALLAPTQDLTPIDFAKFEPSLPRLNTEVTVSGYPFDGRLGSASLNYGIVAEHAGLNGESDRMRLEMATLPSESGSPLLSSSGTFIGLLAPSPATTRSLPETVSFAYAASKISDFASQAGIQLPQTELQQTLSNSQMITLGRNITALVSCWN